MSGQFTADIEAFVAKANVRADQVLRAVSLELLSRVVLRSPVGNPELWAANQVATEGRRAAVAAAEASGKSISRARLEREHPFISGKGYVGGRFRGSWTVTFNDPASQVTETIDPSGAATLENGAAVLSEAEVGVTIYMVSNLPYSQRIEDGWSKQAPAGVVKVTVADFQGIVADASDKASAEDASA